MSSNLLIRHLDVRMDPKIQGAILNGLYNLSAPVQIECQTSNCQWDLYTTLAVTSRCENVTSATTINCANAGQLYSCDYNTPGGFLVQSRVFSSSASGSATRFNSTAITPLRDDVLVIFAAVNMLEPYSLEAPDVTECEMRWVAQSVQNTTVTNGTFHPGITQNYELQFLEDATNGADYMLKFGVSDESTTFPGNSTFSIFWPDHYEIQRFLKELFSSSITDPFGIALQNSTNLSQTVAMISDSMTYAMGQSPSGIKLPGQAITTEQYIRVNWGWIGLSIGEVSMGIAFFITTLIHTWRRKIATWKSSAMILLLTEMEGWHPGDIRMGSAREIEKRANEMRGLLESSESGGQRFRRIN